MLFHGKSSVCVPQTLTKLLLFTRWGIASAPAILYDPYLLLPSCSGQSMHALSPLGLLHWKTCDIREQLQLGLCAMYALRTPPSYPRPAEYICKGQISEFPDWRIQSYSPKTQPSSQRCWAVCAQVRIHITNSCRVGQPGSGISCSTVCNMCRNRFCRSVCNLLSLF